MALTQAQISTLTSIERSVACVSCVATLVLLTTFIALKQLRTLSNTLLFYASFANLFANVAALIGGSALSHPNAALCQFQGFILEMFMQSDPFWSCAMAVNVYLVFFHRFDAARLKKLYWLYALICYGLPFIPALFCLLYVSKGKGKMYGDATLWCWISSPYAIVRIASYYAPIWLTIFVTLVIYTLVGLELFKKRSELHRLLAQKHSNSTDLSTATLAAPERPLRPPPSPPLVTTRVDVSREPRVRVCEPASSYDPAGQRYSINISSLPSTPSSASKFPAYSFRSTPTPTPKQKQKPFGSSTGMDRIKYTYTRTALLFCTSILITWVPASVNRVYGLLYPDTPSFGLNAASAVVLNLQGFWNTVIYFVTSLGIWKAMMRQRREERARKNKMASGKERGLEIVHLGGRRLDDGLESDEETHREKYDGSLVALDTRASDGSGGELV